MSRAKQTPAEPLYVLMTEKREHGYFHIDGRIVAERIERGHMAPYGPDDTYSNGTLYSGLRLRCQGDEQSRARAIAGDRDAPVYGYDVDYCDVHSISRREAVRMARTLTQLEAKLEKLTTTRGYARSYGEYVGRVAEVFGCTGIAFVREARSHEMTGQRWLWESIGQGVTRINRLIATWVDEARPVAAEEIAS